MEAAYEHLVKKQGFREGMKKLQIYKGSFNSENWNNPNFLKSMAVHEFFHSIQQLGYSLTLENSFLIEGTAMWAMREVYPRCVECYIELLEDWLVGRTDANTLKQLGHGRCAGLSGLFWNLISDHYGGAELIRQLFEHPDIRLGVDWPKTLSQLTQKSFLDLWAEFAVALAARQVPDAKWLYPQAEQKTPYVPVPVFVGEWTGQPLTIEQSNWENPYLQLCSEKRGGACPAKTNILPVGSNLTIRYPYGIHFLRIVPKSNVSFLLSFQKDPGTDFRTHVVAWKVSGEYENFSLTKECIVTNPLRYALLQVVVTRGETYKAGTGTYRLNLQEPRIDEYSLCQKD
jgi:hypothetical protein